jgi:hypothetical protein
VVGQWGRTQLPAPQCLFCHCTAEASACAAAARRATPAYASQLAATSAQFPVLSPGVSPGGVFSSVWWRSGGVWQSDFTRPRPLIQLKSVVALVLVRSLFLGWALSACRSDRLHGQASSIITSLPAFDRGIGSLLQLESHPAGHWLPCQTSARSPELALSKERRPSNSSSAEQASLENAGWS